MVFAGQHDDHDDEDGATRLIAAQHSTRVKFFLLDPPAMQLPVVYLIAFAVVVVVVAAV